VIQGLREIQTIIAAQMDEFLKLPDCTADRPSALRNIYDGFTVHTRGLSSLGIDLQHYGSLLIPIIMPKLPNEVLLHMACQHHGSIWKVTDLLDMIMVEVEAREASNFMKLNVHKPPQQHKPPLPTPNSATLLHIVFTVMENIILLHVPLLRI